MKDPNNKFKRLINSRLALLGKSSTYLMRQIPLSKPTYYKQMDEPYLIRSGELTRIFECLGFDDAERVELLNEIYLQSIKCN